MKNSFYIKEPNDNKSKNDVNFSFCDENEGNEELVKNGSDKN